MYIEAVPNRNSPPAILLRESYRAGGRVLKRTICNLTDWPAAHIEGLRGVLKGGTVTRSLPHGHAAAVLGTIRKIGLDTIIGPAGNRCRDLVLAMIASRIIDPDSKLATARALSPATAASGLGALLDLGDVDEDELYTALDWLGARQPAIETALAKRHLQHGTLVLYDLSSSYMEGSCCPLAHRGYSRDGRRGTLQIVYGLLCAPDGCPVAIEAFDGNSGDPKTLAPQITKLKQHFGLDRVVLVGDRGDDQAAKRTDVPGGVSRTKRGSADGGRQDRRPRLDHRPARPGDQGPGQRRGLAIVPVRRTRHGKHHQSGLSGRAADRLPQCQLAARRTHKREELLAATERDLERIRAATQRKLKPLRGATAIALAVGGVIEAHKMRKHFDLTITETSFAFARKTAAIKAEAATDGIYIVRSYKSLSRVERAFRSIKTVDLQVRPVRHWLDGRARAHVFLCMLAYYVECHMRQALAPMLFDGTDKAAAEAARASPVAKAQRSRTAIRKQTTGLTTEGLPVHSFRTLLADLATLARSTIVVATTPGLSTIVLTRPTPVQARAFDLPGIAV